MSRQTHQRHRSQYSIVTAGYRREGGVILTDCAPSRGEEDEAAVTAGEGGGRSDSSFARTCRNFEGPARISSARSSLQVSQVSTNSAVLCWACWAMFGVVSVILTSETCV